MGYISAMEENPTVRVSSTKECHTLFLIQALQDLVRSGTYTDTTLVCSDGELLHNRMIVWMLLPALRHCQAFVQEDNDRFVLLLPDFSVAEVTSSISRIFHQEDKIPETTKQNNK